MNSDWMRSASPTVTDVYTDLHGLQNLKIEKDNEQALRKVSQQFESMFINMLLKNMRAANQVFSKGNMFDSQESQFYRDMHDHQLALSLAHGRGFGVADAMYRQLSQAYGAGDTPRTREVQVNPSDVYKPDFGSADQDFRGELGGATAQDIQTSENEGLGSTPNLRSSIASSPEDFIQKVFDGATKAADTLGVEREVLIAQAALETGWGDKVFARENGDSSFNLFNIKADSRWQGESVAKQTLEFLGGKFTVVADKFRSYESIQDSFEDFTKFIQSSERYLPVLGAAKGGLDFIEGIHKAGYATDPNYVDKVASVYERVKSFVANQDAESASQ